MAGPSLRDPYLRDPLLTQEDFNLLDAAGMSSLRRGYEAGRIGTDVNTRLAQESSLRAAGDLAAADALRAGTRARQLRQGVYSPVVSQVEQIAGPGDALSWAAGQLGQGAASMQDPMLASAGVAALGTGLTFVPNPVAKLAGQSLRFAAPAAGYGITSQQLKGEHYGTLSGDPTVMARFSPQELDDQATTYGYTAGLLDTALPGLAGRAVGGAALRGAVRPRISAGAKVAGGLVGEGATEVAQGELSRALHEGLNPDRDATGDASARLNEFLGGAVGAGGPVLAGVGAGALYRAGRQAPGAVKDAAGSLVDLGKGAAAAVGEKVGRGKDVDLGETLRSASNEKTDASLADLNLLRGIPDDPALGDDPDAFRTWYQEMAPRRAARLRQGLADLVGQGDTRAGELLAAMDTPDRGEAELAADAASEHLIEAMGLKEMAARADEALDGPRRGPAARVGDLLGRGARWAASQAAEGAKAGWEGLTRKRNAQGPGTPFDSARHAAMNAFDDAQETAQAKQRSLSRAQLMGEYLATLAEAQTPRFKAHRVNPESMQRRLGDIGAELASLAESWGLTGQQEITKDKRGDRFDNLKFDLGAIASELRTGLGKDGATQALEGLRQRAGPSAAPLFDYLGEQLKSPGNSQAGMTEAAKALVAHVEPQAMLKLQRQGIDLTSAGAGRELVRTVQKAGRGDERALAQLDKVFGASTTNRMLDTLGMSPAEQQVESAYAEHTGPSGLRLESDSVVEDTPPDFEQRQGQKLYDKTASTRLYGFYGMPRARTDLAGRDPLVGEKDPDFGMRRPRLIPLNDSAAIENSTKRLQKQLGDDPAWSFTPKSALQVMADHEGISLQTALAGRLGGNALSEGTKDGQAEKLGVNPAFINKLMARYRDYMRQEAARSRESDPERAAALTKRMKRASDVLLDRVEQAEGRAPSRTTAGQRDDMLSRAIEYLSTHGMVVAERGTDRDPQRISVEQVMAMIDKAERMASAAERNGETMNDVLHFQSRLANSKKDGPGPVKILAGDVAKFAREARKTLAGGEDRSSSVNADEQYLRDLSDGIAALVASGHVEGLPRGFSGNKMPDNLPLRTMTYWAWQKAKAQRVEQRRANASKQEVEGGGDARKSERNQKAVAGEQAREHFAPDETGEVEVVEEGTYDRETKTRDGLNITRTSKYKREVNEAVERRSDADEFEGQQRETRAAGMDARELPKEVQARTFPRMSMASRGPRLGAQLHAEMLASFDDGLSQARTYLNQAAAKMPQYLSPVAHALSGERFEQLGTTPAEKAAVKALRAETARLLAASNLSPRQKVDLARTLAKPEGRAKVTAQNVAKFLERAAEGGTTPVPATEKKPAMTKAQRDAASSEALADMGVETRTAEQRGETKDKRAMLVGPRDPLRAETERAHGAAKAVADWSDPGRKLNAQATNETPQWLYHGTRAADEALIRGDGSLVLKPSKNFGGKTNGVSFTDSLESAKDYATRIKGGGPQGFTFKGAKIIRIDSRALRGVEREFMSEWADYSGKEVVVPAGMYTIENVARERMYLRDSHLSEAFRDYVKDNYSGMEREEVYADPAFAQEAFLDEIVDSPNDWSAEDVAEARGILRDQFGRGKPQTATQAADWSGPARKLNAQAIGLHSELKRPGFGAAHNSPIKHEGKFDWRKHLGKGEGAWVYGAGTYLSTADSVHKFYKKQFTNAIQTELRERDPELGKISDKIVDLQSTIPDLAADLAEARDGLDGTDFARAAFNVAKKKLDAAKSEVADLQARYSARADALGIAAKSPTYHVSVDIGQDRIMDWNKPLADQHASIRLRAMKAIKEHQLDLDLSATGEQLYKELKEQFDITINAEQAREKDYVRPDPQAKVSDYLQSLGILGHKYIGGSRNEGHNYVIYDDSKIHTNFVAFNAQDLGRAATPEEMQQARDYVKKVLGPQVKVDFEKLTGYSGEWIEAENVIKISTTPGPGAMQVAYHEALHAFFSKFIKNDPKALDTFKALVDDPKLLERLRGLLADHPAALEQLKHREEVLAYAYQFWAADMLDLPTKPRTLFGKIQRFFRRLLGMISDQERAAAILEAFHAGKMSEPSAAGQVIAKALGEGTLTPRAMRKADAFVSKVRELTYPAQSVLATSMSLTAQKLAPMFWTNPGAEAHGADTGEGYINAKEATATKYKNLLSGYIQGLSDRDLRDVATLLQAGTDPAKIPYAPHAEAVKNIRLLLDRFHGYMTKERGLDIGKLEGYFPRVWDVGTMLEKQGEFIDMLLAKYDHVLADGARSSGLTKVQVAQRIFDKLVSNSVGSHALPGRDDGVLAPFFANAMNRELSWLKQEDSAPFESKDLIGTLTGYFHSGARAAEYAHRFGNSGEILEKMLGQVDAEFKAAAAQLVKKGELKQPEAEKWAARRSAEVRKAVGAMEGTLGKDINSAWRNTSAWMTTYQNVRLLPLTLFSSVVDPLGMVARGATMKEAYDSFLRGMREVFTGWADMIRREPTERQADEWERLAMAVGSVDAAMFSHHVADEYSSMYMNKKAKRLNDAFFRLNGMEAWNRGMRVGATQAAVAFITKHAQLPDKTHSARWLKELGLTPTDLTFDDEGKLITHKNELAAKKGIPVDQAEREMEKVHYAIRRWVQGAVLTPNAAQRPSWSSDPHWSFMFHLKQFSYSFHQTLLKRAVNELNYGNLAPVGAFAWYIPVMMVSDIARGLVQGGGELPAHLKGMDLGDHVMRAIERSGLLSVGSIGVDASNDLFSLAGPAVEQIIDSFGQPLGKTVVDALPAHELYAQALR